MKQIRKEIYPIAFFSGSLILKTIADSNGDQTLSLVAMILTLINASWMGYNILKLDKSHSRLKYALGDLIFCAVMWAVVFFLTSRIGNVFTSIICLAVACVYVTYICPVLLKRKVFL